MGRLLGSKDLKKRKKSGYLRRWKKHKQKYKPFPKKPKGHKTELKLYFWQIEKMSKQGYNNWARKLRPFAKKVVYKPFLRVDVPVERISNIQAIKELALDVIGIDGTFVMRGVSHGKTKTKYKWVRLAVIKITSHEDGLRAHVSEVWRLSRYWFYQAS
jgi:hypothetical protein